MLESLVYCLVARGIVKKNRLVCLGLGEEVRYIELFSLISCLNAFRKRLSYQLVLS